MTIFEARNFRRMMDVRSRRIYKEIEEIKLKRERIEELLVDLDIGALSP